MRRKLWSAVMLTALVLGLAGCGVQQEKQNLDAGKVATGAAVYTDVIQNAGTTSEERQRMCLKTDIEPGAVLTEHCLYAQEYGEEDDAVIVQTDHAGNELSRVTLENKETFDGLLCGSDKRIIYARDEVNYDLENVEDEDKDLYSVPVVQTDAGETVQWDQAEKIATCRYGYNEFPNVYLQEPYLIYAAGHHTMVRHNLESGVEETLELPVEFLSTYGTADGYLYLDDLCQDDRGGLDRIDIGKWTLEKLIELENREEQIRWIWVEGSFLYMLIGRDEGGAFLPTRLECFDLEQKKTTGQLSMKEIISFLEKEKICTEIEEGRVDCEGLSVYAGKAYITLSVLEEGMKGAGRMVLLRCTDNDLSDLENESEMTEWYHENRNHSDWSTLDGYGDLYYFVYDWLGEISDSHMMCYHLDTKKIEEVGHDELIWRGYEAVGGW